MEKPTRSNISPKAAYRRIRKYIRNTPLHECRALSQKYLGQVFLKMENWQNTGSFKIRGALNRMLMLTAQEKARGVITASAGNHGLGVAYASEMLRIKARIILPVNASPAKVRMFRFFGSEVVQIGRDYDEAEDVAHKIERDCNITFIHAFDDPRILAGQGTIGLEILATLPQPDLILVPIGGGGLISGIAVAVKQINPKVKIIGIQSKASPAMYASMQANRILETPIDSTVADGLAGRFVSPLTLGMTQKLVDEVILVEEAEIKSAIWFLMQESHILIEGAAAVGIAAILSNRVSVEGKKAVVVLTGRNIDPILIRTILNEHNPDA